MKIGLLICGTLPEPAIAAHGDYVELYKELLGGQGFTFEAWHILDDDFPSSPEDADGWLISGSRHGAYEDHAWIPKLENLIQEIVTIGRPLVGICFGHQIIAQALGGKVEKFSGGWNLGREIYDFAGLDLPLVAWHQDQVIEAPEGVQVIARTDTCQNAALLYGDRAFTMQPHPEFDGETVEILAEFNESVIGATNKERALTDVNEPLANEIIADQISDFFRLDRNS